MTGRKEYLAKMIVSEFSGRGFTDEELKRLLLESILKEGKKMEDFCGAIKRFFFTVSSSECRPCIAIEKIIKDHLDIE